MTNAHPWTLGRLWNQASGFSETHGVSSFTMWARSLRSPTLGGGQEVLGKGVSALPLPTILRSKAQRDQDVWWGARDSGYPQRGRGAAVRVSRRNRLTQWWERWCVTARWRWWRCRGQAQARRQWRRSRRTRPPSWRPQKPAGGPGLDPGALSSLYPGPGLPAPIAFIR